MICLSFDSDHISSERMCEFLEFFSLPGGVTFFCTQPYEILSKTSHEIAPHPFLESNKDWTGELTQKRIDFPKAKGWRSHSCVFSHLLAEWVAENNYSYVSCYDNFGDINITPTQHAWGCWHLPIYYMDNLDFTYNYFNDESQRSTFDINIIDNAIHGSSLYVFDFHPIHLMLNTPDLSYYYKMRERFKRGEELDKLKYKGYGTANYFKDLISSMKKNHIKSKTMSQALSEYLLSQ